MLQDMWYTSMIRRICLESDSKDIVLIVPSDVYVLCSRLVMLQAQRRELELGNMFDLLESKAMYLVSS